MATFKLAFLGSILIIPAADFFVILGPQQPQLLLRPKLKIIATSAISSEIALQQRSLTKKRRSADPAFSPGLILRKNRKPGMLKNLLTPNMNQSTLPCMINAYRFSIRCEHGRAQLSLRYAVSVVLHRRHKSMCFLRAAL
jgi:hypothetical protein